MIHVKDQYCAGPNCDCGYSKPKENFTPMTANDFVTCEQCGKDSGHPIAGSECAYCFECEYLIKTYPSNG